MTSSSSSSSKLTGPVTRFNELDLAGEAPEIDAFCAQYPDLPQLKDRILRVKRLRADLRAAASWSPRESLKPSSEIGGLRLLRLLGAGGMGRVFVAQRGDDPGYYAVKIVDVTNAEEIERFRREAQLAASLDHPNLARILGWGTEGEVAYIVSEIVHGFTVRDLMKTAQKLDRDERPHWLSHALERLAMGSPALATARRDGPIGSVVGIVRQVAEALGYAHRKGVVHRDVKPSNIMVTFDGDAKLIDFGISVPMSGAATRITQFGAFLGTVDYASPEQLRGERERIGAWTDVFGLGVTLFEMLTLQTPFAGQSFQERLDSALSAPPHIATSLNTLVPMSLSAIIRRALDPLPERRFQDGGQFADALKPNRRETLRGVIRPRAKPKALADDTRFPERDSTDPEILPDVQVFKTAFDALRKRRDFVRGDGYLIGAVAPHHEGVEQGALVTSDRTTIAAMILGQHMTAQLHLEGDGGVASRHLLAWLTVEGNVRRVRLMDLNTGLGFFVEGFGRCESVVSDGPLVARVGSYHIVFLPTDEQYWPDDSNEAWEALPPVIFSDTRDAGAPRDRPPALPADNPFQVNSTSIVVLPKPTEYLTAQGPVPPKHELGGTITLVGKEAANCFPLTRAQLQRGVLLGRDTRCDIASELFARPQAVSRVHALLAAESSRTFVFDLASTNGTLVNGKPIVAVELGREANIDLGPGNGVQWQGRC